MEDKCKCETKHTEDIVLRKVKDIDRDYLLVSLGLTLEQLCDCPHHEFC
jgi:hypothetical protein